MRRRSRGWPTPGRPGRETTSPSDAVGTHRRIVCETPGVLYERADAECGVGLEGDVITTNDVAAFEYKEDDVHGRIIGSYKSTHAIPKFRARLAYFGVERAWGEAMRQI